MAKPPSHTTEKEVGAILSNALLALSKTLFFVEMREKNPAEAAKRMARLRAVTEALLNPLKTLTEDRTIQAQEAVYILTAGAMLVHGVQVTKNLKYPALQDIGARYIEDQELWEKEGLMGEVEGE